MKTNRRKGIISIIYPIYWKIGTALAEKIYRIYGSDDNKLPYPLFLFVLHFFGPAMGFGYKILLRKEIFHNKTNKIKNYLFTTIFPVLFFGMLIFWAFYNTDSFIEGFLQNLLADIVLLLLIYYLLPKILNPTKIYKISLSTSYAYKLECQNNFTGIEFEITNSGKEVFDPCELYLEIFIPSEVLQEKNIKTSIFEYKLIDDLGESMWHFSGYNQNSLFVNQKIIIASLIFERSFLDGTFLNVPLTIYYPYKTKGNNFPSIEQSTTKFLERRQISPEKNPILAEYKFIEYFVPMDLREKE